MMEGSPAAATSRRPQPVGPITEVRERLRTITALDEASLQRLPGGARPAMIGAAALAAAFALVRLDPSITSAIPGHPLFSAIYTESPIFLIAALAAGLLSRTTGLVFLATFVVADVIAYLVLLPTAFSYAGPAPDTAAGRFISYWLLWLLVIVIPRLQRAAHAWGAARTGGGFPSPLGAVAGAAAVGAMVWLWTTATPYLIRPAFAFSPIYEAMSPLQERGDVIAGVGAVLALAVGLIHQRSSAFAADILAIAPVGAWTRRLGPIARIAGYALAIILLLGFITSWLDVALLAGGLVIGDLVAPNVARAKAVSETLARVPLAARVILGMVAVFAIAQLIGTVWYQPLLGSEFFPLIVAIAVGFVVFRLILGEVEEQTAPPSAQPTASTVGAATVLFPIGFVALMLATPGTVQADNCSGLFDCAGAWLASIGAGLAAVVAALWAWLKGVFMKTPPVISQLEPLLSEEGAEAQRKGADFLKAIVARRVMEETGDMEEVSRIRNLPMDQFVEEARTGKWEGYLGYSGYTGGTGARGGGGCLPSGTMIEMPDARVPVEEVTAGMSVLTLAPNGERRTDVVERVSVTDTHPGHEVVTVTLDDRRSVRASATHPLADGRPLGTVAAGDTIDGARVITIEREAYLEGRTYDLWPARGGAYLASGVPLMSTLEPIAHVRRAPALAGVEDNASGG